MTDPKFGTWNYRVVRTQHEGEEEFAIHEMHYDSNDVIVAWSAEPAPAVAESLDALGEALSWMMVAIVKPVLERTDLPGGDDD